MTGPPVETAAGDTPPPRAGPIKSAGASGMAPMADHRMGDECRAQAKTRA